MKKTVFALALIASAHLNAQEPILHQLTQYWYDASQEDALKEAFFGTALAATTGTYSLLKTYKINRTIEYSALIGIFTYTISRFLVPKKHRDPLEYLTVLDSQTKNTPHEKTVKKLLELKTIKENIGKFAGAFLGIDLAQFITPGDGAASLALGSLGLTCGNLAAHTFKLSYERQALREFQEEDNRRQELQEHAAIIAQQVYEEMHRSEINYLRQFSPNNHGQR